MEKILHRASDRGARDYGWLNTHYSFSFADWHNIHRTGFGALRVLNDDVIAPDSGFPMHGHRDMEIITIVTAGAVTHTDSLGNEQTVSAGEVQVMSAGTGVVHAEQNASAIEPLELFQLWIRPKEQNIPPRYAQKAFPVDPNRSGFATLVSPDGAEGSLVLNQDAWLYYVRMNAAGQLLSPALSAGHGAYIFVVSGTLSVEGQTLGPRDALGVLDVSQVTIASEGPASALFIEVPME